MRIVPTIAICAALMLPVAAQADIFGLGNGKQVFRAQAKVLEKRARLGRKATVSLETGKVITPTKWGTPGEGYDGAYKGRYLSMARAAARRHGVPEDLFLRLVEQESGWNPRARSQKGALGLAQLMPQTAARLGIDPQDPYQNLEGGARYLARQYRAFGSWRLALAAYNAGPEAVEKYDGVPPYKETRNYVKVIWGS